MKTAKKYSQQSFFVLLFLAMLISTPAQAINVELGLLYNYNKSYFDADNSSEQQSATGTISFYFWEKIALETSYTNGLYVKKEKQPDYSGAFLRTTTQYSDIYGANLIYIFADRKATFQPFVKGGVAYVRIKQQVQDNSNNPWDLTYSGYSPSYGVGFKFFITEAFALRASYDSLETPTNNGTKVTQLSGHVGLSWMF